MIYFKVKCGYDGLEQAKMLDRVHLLKGIIYKAYLCE